MAKVGIRVSVDSYLTDTRMHTCLNTNCSFNEANGTDSEAGLYCSLKRIDIGHNGQCTECEDRR